MTFTYKISKRLAQCYAVSFAVAALSACAADRSIVAPFPPDSTQYTPAPVASVTITPPVDSGFVGSAVQFVAVTRDSAGTPLTGRSLAWMSGDTGIVTVNATGSATLMGPGTTYIEAVAEGQTGRASVTSRAIPVTAAPVASVTLAPGTASLSVGAAVAFTATLRDSAGAPLTGRPITWTSSAPAVATVSTVGVATALSGGTAGIIATSEGKSDTATVTVTTPVATHAGYYAAPTGTSTGTGSFASPWDLRTALTGGNGGSVVQPGDTIWLRGGTYQGPFSTTVHGAPGNPVIVRQYPGERAIIDGVGTPSSTSVFHVGGDWSVFWGFEITNSDPVRTTTSTTNNVRPNVVSNYAAHTKYIALVVHDGGVAFYTEPIYPDVEVVGCIIYNNGWQAPDRGHGHALYMKSNTGPVVLRDNVIFNQFGYGVHEYSNAGSGQLNNIRIAGNIAFNNGTLSNNSTSANILLGGADPATGDVVEENFTYLSPGVAGTNVQIGYGALVNGSVDVRNNTFVGGARILDFGYWGSSAVVANTLVGSGNAVALNDPATGGLSWALNVFYRDPAAAAWSYAGSSYVFLAWQLVTGLATSGLALPGAPVLTQVVVRPNPYETGRANIVVYNWGHVGSVLLDLTGVLPVGAKYEIRNVQSLFSAPVVTGTFGGGSVSLPLTGVLPPAPIGMGTSPAPATGADFNTYVLTVVP